MLVTARWINVLNITIQYVVKIRRERQKVSRMNVSWGSMHANMKKKNGIYFHTVQFGTNVFTVWSIYGTKNSRKITLTQNKFKKKIRFSLVLCITHFLIHPANNWELWKQSDEVTLLSPNGSGNTIGSNVVYCGFTNCPNWPNKIWPHTNFVGGIMPIHNGQLVFVYQASLGRKNESG